jgi:4-hydroxy-tetrahydrodipicolinate reductase
MQQQAGLRTVHIGFGTIGQLVYRQARQRGFLPAAIIDPQQPRDLGALMGESDVAVPWHKDVEALPPADIAFVCTGSRLADVAPILLRLANAGLHVVSTCEELAYPWADQAELAERIDACARAANVVVVGAGVNPGFVLDALVLDCARACLQVSAVRASRSVDVGTRRRQLHKKVGVGLSPEVFRDELAAGRLGHVGLKESVAMVCAGLQFHEVALHIASTPVLAERDVLAGNVRVAVGRCLGIRQIATAVRGDREVVRLELEMALGLAHPEDAITIDGDPPIAIRIPGGTAGDKATAALAVSVASGIVGNRPGLRTMPELPISVMAR